MNFSVLMSVYFKEKPEYLDRALESLIHQSLQPNEIVLVKDGTLTPELDRVINSYQNKYQSLFKIISYEKNMGLGHALRLGVEECSNNIIARMDSDDICHKDRFKEQISFLEKNPDIDIVGSYITEFEGDEDNIIFSRITKSSDSKIKRMMRYRNPFNHMTVMYKKSSVIKAGNYEDVLYFEDYHLWIKMALKGMKMANLPLFLVNARSGLDMLSRRKGFTYIVREYRFLKRGYNLKFWNIFDFISLLITRVTTRFLPKFLLMKLYNILRN
ncbi:MAG: amylovoran biosynthesis protein AmsE [Candidatus Cloacimonadota bacterium]|nr:MAG: amylovoran biosynthesis protein AmsE [Candidatus Cloacimonadota bacterium]PIE77635.1 MAG: amylovoran biosynthesis protein AmsE [Candidatus Delongbacteria bacterium]